MLAVCIHCKQSATTEHDKHKTKIGNIRINMSNYTPLEAEILRWLKKNHDRIVGMGLDKIRKEVADVVPHEESEFLDTLRWLNMEDLIHFTFDNNTRRVTINIKKDGLRALRHIPTV